MEMGIPDHREALKKNHSKGDLVARWVIPVRGKLFDIELEHGTISGKRVIWVNGEEILRRDMMYRLVGEDTFFLEDKRCIIHVRPAPAIVDFGLNFDFSGRFSPRRASSTRTSCSSTASSAKSTIRRNQKSSKPGKFESTTRHIAWCSRRTRSTRISTASCGRRSPSSWTAARTRSSSTMDICSS